MVSAHAIEEFEKNDVELSVPEGAPRPVLIIVMGVAACGKSTIGAELSSALKVPFIDGDTLHPSSNVDKMSKGIPLNDDDRLPWLALIRSTAERKCKEEWEAGKGRPAGKKDGLLGRPCVVIACSALKVWYRDILRGAIEASPPEINDLPPAHPTANKAHGVHLAATENLLTLFLYCKGTPELLAGRIAARKGHFMGAKMLESQLATLEDPTGEPDVVDVDISGSREQVGQDAVRGIREMLRKQLGE
ncbi:gluconokinase, partial [Tremellales sp. Uapishka_1]